MVVKISKKAFDGMVAHAEEGYPNEVCGVMIGTTEEIYFHRKCKNLIAEDEFETEFKSSNKLNKERMRDRYELDPKSYMEADEWARSKGLEIVGIYHSHPDHPSQPSETDRKVASPYWGYIIFSINNGEFSDARLWYLNEGNLQFELREFELTNQ